MFKQRKHILCTDRPSACSTDATRMDKDDIDSTTNVVVSIENSVRNALDQICSRVENLRGSQCLEIVESFLLCFLARRSGSEKMFTDIEYGRFIRSFSRTSQVLLKYESDDCREQTFAKYWIDSYLARVFLDDARPEKPEWLQDSLFAGYCKRLIDRRILHRDCAFIYSLAKGSKQMWPPLKELNVRNSIKKSIDRLAKPRNFSGIPRELVECIEGVSKKIFTDISVNKSNLGSKFMPSLSACLQASVKDGGVKSLFKTLLPPTREMNARYGKLRAADIVVNQWRQDCFDEAIKMVEHSLVNDVPSPDGIVGDNLKAGLFDTSFVPIFEPGKIRSISKSDGFLATALQPLQGQMLDSWKKTRQSTMLDDDLTEVIRLMDKELIDEDYFCSGDYEDATNLLFREATIAAFNGVPREHPLNVLAFLSLTSGSMYYPDPDKDWPKKGKKPMLKLGLFEGQLMGHTLSFPLLCVINLAVLRYSLNQWVMTGRTWHDRSLLSVRAKKIYRFSKVNGDDILFKGPLELIEIFKLNANLVGFKISQGKNYISKDTCLINSQLFRRVDGAMKRFGYLNLRLVKGMNVKSRKAVGEHPVNPTYIGKDLGKMATLTPWTASVIPYSMKRFSMYTRTYKWFQPNWYLPVHLGGYGVPIEHAPHTMKVTRGQRLVAAMFVRNPKLLLFRSSELFLKNGSNRFNIIGVLNPVVRQGDTVLESHEVDISFDPDARDPWLERLAYISHAMQDSHMMNPDAGTIKMCTHLKHHSRFQPMSDETIRKYWTIRLVGTKMAPCPPFHSIRIKESLFFEF